VASGAVVLALVASTQIEKRPEVIPDRLVFAEFPAKIGPWEGKRDTMEQIYIDELKFDDYIISSFSDGKGTPIEFYAAYYGSQATGQSSHSPRNCLPGGGWQIKESATKQIPGVLVDGVPLIVNRFVIRKEDIQQLVYYWFQGRGRITTNEYMVKWYLFWDALTKQRTDGALVRLTTYVPPGDDIVDADKRLTQFAKDVENVLTPYIPN
jgi:EpsI family protein